MGEKNSSTEKRFGTQISEKSNYEEEKTKTQPKVNQDYHFGAYSQDEMDSKATFSNILKNVFLLQN